MLLITLEKNGVDCHVELDRQDISKRIIGLEVFAAVHSRTEVRLTLSDDVTIVGEAGKLEFIKRENHD
jgi:nucleoside-triphosphatase THEP1